MKKYLSSLKSILKNYPQIIIVVLPIIFFFEPIFQLKILYWGTTSTQFFPWMEYASQEILNGHLPLWNPYNGWGAPLLANYQSALFYPLNWVMIVFYLLDSTKGIFVGYTLLFVIHLQICGLGFYRLLSKFRLDNTSKIIGSMAFIFSGYLLTRLNFISMIWAMVWIPWIIAGMIDGFSTDVTVKRIINVLLIVPLSMQLLAGHAQTVYYTMLMTTTFFIVILFSHSHKIKHAVSYILSVAISLGLCAIQLIPTAEYLLHSQRSNEIGYEYAANFSFWPWRLLSAIFPDFWGNPIYGRYLGGGSYWEDHIYLGVIPVILILFAIFMLLRSRDEMPLLEKNFYWVSMILIPISFFFALGKNFFVYPFFYRFVPTFDMFQAPSRFLLVYVFCGSVLAAVGFQIWIKKNIPGKKTGIFIFVFIAIIIGVLLSEIFLDVLPKNIEFSIYFGSGLAITFGLLSIVKNFVPASVISGIKVMIILLIFFDLVIFLSQNELFKPNNYYDLIRQKNQNLSSETVYLDDKTEAFIKFNQNFRFDRFQEFKENLSSDLLYLPNTNLFSPQYQMVNNFDPFIPGNYSEFMDRLRTVSKSKQKEILAQLGTSAYVSIESTSKNKPEVVLLDPQDIVQWYDCGVRRQAHEILDDMVYNDSFFEKDRCLSLSAEYDKYGDSDLYKSSPSTSTNIIGYNITSKNQFEIRYESETDGWILIRSNYYPGWKATLDQELIIKTYEADFLFTGILVPAGNHEIVFRYEPISFQLGLGISILSMLILLLLYKKIFEIKTRLSTI